MHNSHVYLIKKTFSVSTSTSTREQRVKKKLEQEEKVTGKKAVGGGMYRSAFGPQHGGSPKGTHF